MASFGLTCTCGVHHQGDLCKKKNKDVVHCVCGAVGTMSRTHKSTHDLSPDDEVTHIDYADH